ncbi:MAG: hypothetical protein KKF00_10895 [Proteobacteria bacterium]|nr:hypothetical protein [Pseudomonadota bacterium]
MVFKIQQISNYGTSTPSVARTVVQGSQLLQSFPIDEHLKKLVTSVLFDLQQHLIRCVSPYEQISAEVDEGVKKIQRDGFETQSQGRTVTLPSVKDISPLSESFLQGAKLAIIDCGRIFNPFYGGNFDHRFNKIKAWADNKFGKENNISRCCVHWEPFIIHILKMRDAVDHPHEKPGERLLIYNFSIKDQGKERILHVPKWQLLGDTSIPIVANMAFIIENIIRLSEDVLTFCLLQHRGTFPLYIYEIPEDKRDPNCPIRLGVGMDLPRKDA